MSNDLGGAYVDEVEASATGEGVLQSSDAGDEAREDDADAVNVGAGEC
jgi:hypothetical protein